MLQPGSSAVPHSKSKSSFGVSSIWSQSSYPLPVLSSYSGQILASPKYSTSNSYLFIKPSSQQTTQHFVTSGPISPTIAMHMNVTAPQNHSSNFQPNNNLSVSFEPSLATISSSSDNVTNQMISYSSRAVSTSMGPGSSLSTVKLNQASSKVISQTFLKNTPLPTTSHLQKSMQPSAHLMMNSSIMSSAPVKATTRGNIISRTVTHHYNENVSTTVYHNTSKGRYWIIISSP